ncbi:MAG: hypothetical protein DHS20C21_17250 [Gemmatimonadota bacterium]|nr:MAG: hypothetical protein DHS20C21_17250 [Gemmatimonadota bacterium]
MTHALARTGWLAALTVITMLGCGRAPAPRDGSTAAAPPPDRDRSSVLFVSLDTFRADISGSGGHPGGRTPHLDRLARTGTQFRSGLSSSPLTLPSHSTMLTGLTPPAHGVRDNGTFRLPDAVPTLTADLRERGLRTGAFVAAFPLDERFGLAQGFEVYDDRVDGAGTAILMAQRRGDRVAAAAAEWWSSLDPTERTFSWVHLFDAHTPHDAPRPFVQASGQDTYLAEAAYTDRFLGQAVRSAQAAIDDLWVVLLADHGESRGDHDEATHGLFIYGATIQVPAIIWPAPRELSPGAHPATFPTLDLPATVFDLLGLPPDEAPGSGTSRLRGETAPAYMESLYALYHHGWAPLMAVQDGRWKYVSAPTPELYDLEMDPGETRNVIDDYPDIAADLADRVDALAAETGEAASESLDESSRAALESLGYVTTTVDVRPDAPDPKRMIHVQNLLEQAQSQFYSNRFEEALRTLRAALAKDPNNKDIYQTFGILYTAMGRDSDAADSFWKCLELPPHRNDRVPRYELASAYIRLGRAELAIPHLEKILQEDVPDASTWHNLGVAWEQLGQRDKARVAWQRAVETDPGFELARQALAKSAKGR